MFESEIAELYVNHAAQLRARQAQQTFETAGRQQQRDLAEHPASADAPAHSRYTARLPLIIEFKSCVEPAEQQRPRPQLPAQLFQLHIAKTRRLRTTLPHAAGDAGENHCAAETRRRPSIGPGGGNGGDEEHAIQHHAEQRIEQCPVHEPSRLRVPRAFTRPTCSRRSPARSTMLTPSARCKRPRPITMSSNAACSSTTRTTLLPSGWMRRTAGCNCACCTASSITVNSARASPPAGPWPAAAACVIHALCSRCACTDCSSRATPLTSGSHSAT